MRSPLSPKFALLLGAFAGCQQAGAATTTFDFNAGDQGWSVETPVAFDGPFAYDPAGGTGGTGGWTANGQAPSSGHTNTSMITSPSITVQAAGSVSLAFDHMYTFETGSWDGGAVFLSVNGGAFAQVASASFITNGYNGTVVFWGAPPGDVNNQSLLAGLPAFVENSPGRDTLTFMNSSADLGTFAAGDTFNIRFLASSDENTQGAFGNPQWAIDNVALTNTVPEPGTIGLLAAGLALAARRRRN